MVRVLLLALGLLGFAGGVFGMSTLGVQPAVAQACRPPQCG